MTTTRDAESISHMLECAQAILSYMKGRRRALAKDGMLRDAVLRRFEVMGEAATRVTPQFRDANPDIPWKRIVAFRNVLIHGYDRIESEQVLVAVDALPDVVRLLQNLRP